jgi:hypothetical protein
MRPAPGHPREIFQSARNFIHSSYFLLALSLVVQLALGLFFGHAYDMRIYMATGNLVANGQDPYIAHDLSAVFHDPSFQGITSVGYPPPWPLLTGLIYSLTYKIIPNLLLYNLALKLPIIAANISLAYLVARILDRLGAPASISRRAWFFMLFNPFLLYISVAWGQFDSIVAFLSILSLLSIVKKKMIVSALLLALAITFKPTALPLIPAIFLFILGKPIRQILLFLFSLAIMIVLIAAMPFLIFSWDPSPILQHWNAHFTVGGGMSFMTFLELIKNSYQLPGLWWLLGLLWIPALAFASLALKPGGRDCLDLLKKSLALVMIFFLTRSWLSETNLILVLPMILILSSLGELDPRLLTAVWTVAFIFSFFNTSTFQLLFPSLPVLMNHLLQVSDIFRTARLALRTIVVIPWLVIGGYIFAACLKNNPVRKVRLSVTDIRSQI